MGFSERINMSDKKYDGGPAYPAHDYLVGDINKDKFQKLGESRGMSKREAFAMAAMQGILSNPGLSVGWRADMLDENIKLTIKASLNCADALLEELKK